MAKGEKAKTKRLTKPVTKRVKAPPPKTVPSESRRAARGRPPKPGARRPGRPKKESSGELGVLLAQSRQNGRLSFRDIEELAPAAFNDPGALDRLLQQLEDKGIDVEGALGGVYEEEAEKLSSHEPDPLHLYFA